LWNFGVLSDKGKPYHRGIHPNFATGILNHQPAISLEILHAQHDGD